jgi:peptidoglycan/xylan/chitin deacetylase (PgdA/CDA1 family)/glycosyltransferase involved in cell wall biosynthesis
VNILHVLSQHEVTGAETYAAALIARQARDGHRVTVVSDTLSTPVAAEYLPMPIGKRDYPQRLRNIVALRRLIRARGIHLVHAHSRAASWVAFFATRGTPAAVVSTLHAIQPPHRSARAFSVYGHQMIAVSRGVHENAVRDLGLPAARVHVVPNGVDLERFRPGADAAAARRDLGLPPGGPVVALVGRLSGPRVPVAKAFLSEVFPRVRGSVPGARLVVVGGMTMPPDFSGFVAQQNLRLAVGATSASGAVSAGGAPDALTSDASSSGAVRLLGHQPDVRLAIAAADVVVGAGRSAIEALASGRPVVALGEAQYAGVVSAETTTEAMRTNFGDTGVSVPADPDRIAADLVALLTDAARRETLAAWGRAFAERHYDVAVTWRRVEALYRQARALKSGRRVPVVMYHRVVERPPAEGRHGIWVTRERFAAQLDALARRRFTTITFADYAAYLAGERPLPPRPIILTFDDGYADNGTLALPLLRERGMKAVVFLIGDARITGNVWDQADGEPAVELLGDEQIREMAAQGIEFGSHSRTHARLAGLPAERLRVEVAGSKRAVEERAGAPVLSLCYPYGAVDETVKEAVAEAGYAFGVASDSGPLRIGEDLYEIRRAQVFPATTAFGFWKKTSGWYSWYKETKRRLQGEA